MGNKKLFFLTFSILQLFKNVYAEIKSDIINNLTSDLKLELNIFLNNSADCANELYKRCALTPKIILDYDNAERIKGGITEEILTIAFVEENGTNRTMNLLVELLWELHYTNVLFVYESAQEVSSLTTLFQLCWRNGFVNVLALVNETLYTYQPFPRIKVVALSSLKSYYDKSHLRNFQGYTLRSSISNNAPRVYNYKDINGNSANGGYLYAAVALFLQYYNGTFQEVRMPNYHMNTTVIIKAFENKEIDILPDLLFMYPNYSHSAVVYNYRTLLMAPYAKPLPLNMYILKPMTYFTWLHIVLAICYATLAQMLLSWLCECRVNFGMAFLRTLSSILYLPSYYYGHGSRAQIFCTILLMICSFLLTTLYQSNFTSMIISRLYEPQINSMADIEHTKFSLPMTVEDIAYMSKLSDIPQIIYDRLIEASPMEIDRLIRDFNTSYIYTFNEDKVQYFMYQQKFLRIPRFQVLNEELTQVPLFVSLPCGSPFLKLFNHHLGKIFDTGIFLKIIINCAEEGIFTKDIRFFHTLSIFYEPLELKHFTPILIVWAFGMLCALICFLIELKMVAWRKEVKNEKVKRNTERHN